MDINCTSPVRPTGQQHNLTITSPRTNNIKQWNSVQQTSNNIFNTNYDTGIPIQRSQVEYINPNVDSYHTRQQQQQQQQQEQQQQNGLFSPISSSHQDFSSHQSNAKADQIRSPRSPSLFDKINGVDTSQIWQQEIQQREKDRTNNSEEFIHHTYHPSEFGGKNNEQAKQRKLQEYQRQTDAGFQNPSMDDLVYLQVNPSTNSVVLQKPRLNKFRHEPNCFQNGNDENILTLGSLPDPQRHSMHIVAQSNYNPVTHEFPANIPHFGSAITDKSNQIENKLIKERKGIELPSGRVKMAEPSTTTAKRHSVTNVSLPCNMQYNMHNQEAIADKPRGRLHAAGFNATSKDTILSIQQSHHTQEVYNEQIRRCKRGSDRSPTTSIPEVNTITQQYNDPVQEMRVVHKTSLKMQHQIEQGLKKQIQQQGLHDVISNTNKVTGNELPQPAYRPHRRSISGNCNLVPTRPITHDIQTEQHAADVNTYRPCRKSVSLPRGTQITSVGNPSPIC